MKVTTALLISASIVLGSLGVFLLTRILGPLPISITQTTTNKLSSFDVTGETSITAVPDKAQVDLGITINNRTVKAAQDQANTVINDITKALKEMGVDAKDIKTQNYSINPSYDYASGTQRITGYNVDATLEVTLKDFTKLNDVIDAATSLGANQVHGVSFSLSEEKQKEIDKQAREEAIADAKTKAQELANIAGMKLGKIINIIENTPYTGGGIRPMYEMAADAKSALEPTQIQPGSNTYQYSVVLSYETF